MSNYEWEKQYTRQRIDGRLRDAEMHRLATQGPDAVRGPWRNPLAAILRALGRLFPARRTTANPSLIHSDERV